MNYMAIVCYGIILVCWGLIGFVFYLDTAGEIGDMLWYKKIISYALAGPIIWVILLFILVLVPYVIDPFIEWLKGDNHG